MTQPVKTEQNNEKPNKPNKPPRARVANCNENGPVGVAQPPIPQNVSDTPLEDKSEAQWAYERLILYINHFEEQLDNEHEVAMGFAGGDAGVLRIEGLGFFEPDMLTFYGTDADGAKNQLIQHVSQLSVMLRALPIAIPNKKPNRIGFQLAAELEKSEIE